MLNIVTTFSFSTGIHFQVPTCLSTNISLLVVYTQTHTHTHTHTHKIPAENLIVSFFATLCRVLKFNFDIKFKTTSQRQAAIIRACCESQEVPSPASAFRACAALTS
jgi:hypothetical protein